MTRIMRNQDYARALAPYEGHLPQVFETLKALHAPLVKGFFLENPEFSAVGANRTPLYGHVYEGSVRLRAFQTQGRSAPFRQARPDLSPNFHRA